MSDTITVRIDNIDELAKIPHSCQNSELFTQLQINLATQTEAMSNLTKFLEIQGQQLDRINSDINGVKLKLAEQTGQSKWTDRFWGVGVGVCVPIIVFAVIWILEGGVMK